MDTKIDSAASDIPTFKVARVGNDRKRKGGAFSFLRSGGTRGVWTGATGGAGAGGSAVGALGVSFGKVMMSIVLSSMIGSAAIYMGAQSAAHTSAAPKKPALFQDKGPVKLEGDTTNLPTTANSIPNSLGYVAGSKDGLTPEERAKKEADAAAAAEAQRIADEEAAKKAAVEKTAAAPVDPNALLASAKADGDKDAKGTAFGKKFGALSTSMGGGSALTGGAGLSGGVTRQFGSSGSISKGAGGQMTAMKGSARTTTSKAALPRLAGSKVKGFARKQLANANAYSRRGMAAGKGESASSDASSAFDNNPGAGTIISGPGISNGTKPQGAGDTATPNGGGNGSPTDSQQGDCGAGQAINASGACQQIATNGGQDAKPALTMMANVVMALLTVVGVVAAIAAASGPWGWWMAPVLVAIGAIISLLGVAMMAMGDYVTGGLATVVGGVIGYLAWGSAPVMTVGQGLVIGFGSPVLMMVTKMMDKGNHKAPEAAQQ